MWEGWFALLPTTETPAEKSRHSLSDFRVSDLPISTMEQRIQYCRIHSGLSCAEISQQMGIHSDYYYLLEQKADRIGPDKLMRFCSATRSEPGFILYGASPPPVVTLTGATIGERIREYRLSTGLSARQFGYRMLGAKRTSSLSAWESGSTIPEMRSLMMIANAFGISAVSFLPECSME